MGGKRSRNDHKLPITDCTTHLMTYGKVKWVRKKYLFSRPLHLHKIKGV